MQKNKAFTIIEVMVVLAIAGLIMVIVFIAIPQLQRNVRDHKRKTIAETFIAQIQTYAGNNQGMYPFAQGLGRGSWGDFYNRYIKGYVDDIDPTTGKSVFGDGPLGDAGPNPEDDDAEACSYTGLLVEGVPCTYKEYSPDWVDPGKAQIYFDAKCNGETPVSTGANPSNKNVSDFIIIIGLERPGTYYCIGH